MFDKSIKDIPVLNKLTSRNHTPAYHHHHHNPNHTLRMPVGRDDQNTGVTGAAKFVTSTLGNTVGGVTRTVGNVTGAATKGVGDTITSAGGSAGRPVGDAIGNVGGGLQNALNSVGKGVEDAGQWRKS